MCIFRTLSDIYGAVLKEELVFTGQELPDHLMYLTKLNVPDHLDPAVWQEDSVLPGDDVAVTLLLLAVLEPGVSIGNLDHGFTV